MLVSVCVIAYNEEGCLNGLFDDIKAQTYNHSQIEVVLVNNGSTDNTQKVMSNFANNSDFYDVRVINRERGNQAQGWNTALMNTKGDIIIKVDAHGKIPDNFVENNVNTILQGEAVCGGGRPNIPVKETPWDNTLLVAEECMFGGSFAKYRNPQQNKEYINSIFNGAYRKDVFAKVGGFNEALGRTEDNEFHCRVTQAGFKICCSPDIISYQYIRSSLKGMIQQKYLNGYWIGLTVKKYPKCLSLFHFAPLTLVLGLIACCGFLAVGFPWFLIALAIMYMLFDMYITYNALNSGKKNKYMVLLPFIFPALHISYGVGTILGLLHPNIKSSDLKNAKERVREVKRYFNQ